MKEVRLTTHGELGRASQEQIRAPVIWDTGASWYMVETAQIQCDMPPLTWTMRHVVRVTEGAL